MESQSNSVLETILNNFTQKTSVKNIVILDLEFKKLLSAHNVSSKYEELLNFIRKHEIFKKEFIKDIKPKNLNQIILDFLDNFTIISILKTEKYMVTFIENKKDLVSILNELNSLIKKVEEFYYSITVIDKYHIINLDENIKKLEKYLEAMQTPSFKEIKKLIEYLS